MKNLVCSQRFWAEPLARLQQGFCEMKKILALAATAAVLALAGSAKADPVNVTYYSNFSEVGGTVGITMSDPFFSETLPGIDINFANAGPPGRPTPGDAFAADFTGDFTAPSTGSYNLTFGSDDASYLFVDGALFASDPNNHGFGTTTSPVSLTSGVHTFELKYDNVFCCGAQVAFDLDPNLAFTGSGTPEPATWGLMLVGFGGLGAMMRRRRSLAALAA